MESRRVYQLTLRRLGLLLWLHCGWSRRLPDTPGESLLFLLPAIPLIIIVGLFPITFLLPTGWKSTQENVTFTLIDAFVLAIAGWYGICPAVLIAGIEGFISSRRQVRRLSSNLFSAAIMSLTAAAASVCLSGLLGNGWTGAANRRPSQHLRRGCCPVGRQHRSSDRQLGSCSQLCWRCAMTTRSCAFGSKTSVRAAPMFLPTSVAASLIFFGAQNGAIATMAICGPVLLAVYFGHNQNRVRAEQAEASRA